MHWALFLHLYQPYYQQSDVFERIVGRSYRPIIEGLFDRPRTRITLNVSAALLELFEKHDNHDLIEKLAEMGQRGQVEFLASAKYHTLLPFLPPDEIKRQIDLNAETCRRILGDSFQPTGIFLPEMAYAPKLNPILESLGLEYVLLDELALGDHTKRWHENTIHVIKDTKLKAYFRHRQLSNAIMHGAVRDLDSLKRAGAKRTSANMYTLMGMDGEVFGWHHPGHEELLFQMLEDHELNMVQIGSLQDFFTNEQVCEPISCGWADSEDDIKRGLPFFSWRDPANPIQKLEWQLQQLALKEFGKLDRHDSAYGELRAKLDPALASDVFFWSSARPWWSIELIEEGAFGLYEIIRDLPTASAKAKQQGEKLYREILDLAFTWRRSGKIARQGRKRAEILRIPFKERTDEATFKAFMNLMKRKELQAVQKQDYEQAILWRDGQHALEHRSDVYDAYHVIDMLNATIPRPEIERILTAYRKEYQRIRGGQPEQRSN